MIYGRKSWVESTMRFVFESREFLSRGLLIETFAFVDLCGYSTLTENFHPLEQVVHPQLEAFHRELNWKRSKLFHDRSNDYFIFRLPRHPVTL